MTGRTDIASRRATSRPRLLLRLAALAVLLAALILVLSVTIASSDARDTSVKVNAGNAFSAGSLALVNSKSGSAVISASGLMPGGSATGSLTITVQGNYTAAVTLINAGISDTPSSPALSQALTLLVEDITGTAQTLWSGTMSTLGSVSLGQIASGSTRTYRFTATFPSANAVSGLQNASTTMTMRFTGVAQ
jgi:hypothetical protein